MKALLLVLGLLLLASTGCQTGYVNEILPGVRLYGNTTNFEGRLVFVLGRFPEPSDKNLPPAKVLSFDFATGVTTNLWDIPCAGKLTVSQDGEWLGMIFPGRGMPGLPPKELVICSVLTHETQHYRFPLWDDVGAVVVDGYLFVQSGESGRRTIGIHDLRSGTSSRLLVNTNRWAAHGDYRFSMKRMADPRKVFFIYDPGGPRSVPDYAGGEYSYDTVTHTVQRVGGMVGSHDYAQTGEAIYWEPKRHGWSLVARNLSGHTAGEREIFYSWGERDWFMQLSPCRKYALLERFSLRYGWKGANSDYILCDLQSGKHRLFLEGRPSEKHAGAFIGPVFWIRGKPRGH